ncbi:MAG TPA: ABC transporter permease [Candidatus Sulfotelmatobacter sp.]|nr:ABC transporter permease [Candidatus Sulfotelmatobacter sp.]
MSLLSRLFANRRRELEEEIQSHLQMAIQDRTDRGESPEQAEAAAIRELGNFVRVNDITRETRGWVRRERIAQDLKYALRQLRTSPGFAITVIGTLALGLGATGAMFTVVDRVLLRSLPYENAQQIVEIKEAGRKGVRDAAPFLDLQQWRERSHTLSDVAFYSANKHVSFLEGNTGATQVVAPRVSANLFALLGTHPAIGRGFEVQPQSESVRPQDAQTMILSDTVWRTVYGSDANILGKAIKLNGESYTVVGVMPRGFTFPFGGANPVVWTPIVLTEADATRIEEVIPTYAAIARLKSDVTLQSAEAELKGIQTEVSKGYTDPYDREEVSSIQVQRYGDSLVGGDVSKALLALFGAAVMLWLIACVNVTSLLLARSTARQREIAVRGALGASRGQIVLQFLIEGLVLSGIASVLGLGLAVLTVRLFEHALATQFNIHATLTPSASVILILLGLTLVSALMASIWPAIGAARASIEPALRRGSAQGGTGRAQHRTRALLVVSEIAMSLTLLVGCGLLLRTIYVLRHVPLGFRTDHVIVANMTIPSFKFAGRDIRTELYQPLLERVQHLPGVQSASLMTEVPLGKTFQMVFTFAVEGNTAADIRQRDLSAQFRAVGPEMQRVFGFRMAEGRFFNEQDTAGSQPVVVVNRAFVKGFLGGDQDPKKILGANLIGYGKHRRAVVVGVLDDERQVSIAEQSQPEIEVCIPQITPDTSFYKSAEGLAMDLAVRTERSPSSVVPELRRLMQDASPELATSNFTTMDQVVEDSYGSQQLAARILEMFGGCALLLCVAGIYGLLAYLVTQRTRELGLRIALGAQRSDVMWLVLRQATWMLLVGSGIGLVLAYLSSVLLKTFLYGVKPNDPWTMGVVTLLLMGGGIAAAYLPARRAAGVDPMQALRTE